jgi:Domain of unknown function (DUF5615)
VRILFDQGTPVPLRRHLTEHDVATAYERGWSRLVNGALLDVADQEGFEVFVTTDSNLKYQQNLAVRRMAIVVLSTTSWPRIQRALDLVIQAIEGATELSYVEVLIP